MNIIDRLYLREIIRNIDNICSRVAEAINNQNVRDEWQIDGYGITPEQVAEQLAEKGGWREYLGLRIQESRETTADAERIVEGFIVNLITLYINENIPLDEDVPF